MKLRSMGLAIVTLTLLTPLAVSAKMYKWTDDEGNVHYTQTPPPDREAKTIAPPPTPKSVPTKKSTPDNGEQEPAEEGEGFTDAYKKAIKMTPEERAAQIEKNCRLVKQNLTIYRGASRINEGGKTIVLTDEERAKRVAEAEADLEKYCKAYK